MSLYVFPGLRTCAGRLYAPNQTGDERALIVVVVFILGRIVYTCAFVRLQVCSYARECVRAWVRACVRACVYVGLWACLRLRTWLRMCGWLRAIGHTATSIGLDCRRGFQVTAMSFVQLFDNKSNADLEQTARWRQID